MGRHTIYPSWTASIGSMLAVTDERGHNVEAWCDKCRECRHLKRPELERIAKAKGMAYSLFNRRTRCRMTKGCKGWVTFRYQRGAWAYGLYDDEMEMRWFLRG